MISVMSSYTLKKKNTRHECYFEKYTKTRDHTHIYICIVYNASRSETLNRTIVQAQSVTCARGAANVHCTSAYRLAVEIPTSVKIEPMSMQTRRFHSGAPATGWTRDILVYCHQ